MPRYFLLEGEQKDAYLAKKAKEKEDREKAEKERYNRRFPGISGDDSILRSTPGHKKAYSGFGLTKEEQESKRYKGQGNRSDYIITSSEDSDRSKRTREMVDKESDKRREQWHKSIDDMDEYRKKSDEFLSKSYPGERPKGLLKGKEKKEYDKQRQRYNGQREEVERHREELNKKINNSMDAYDRAKDHNVYDATNRHLRKEDKKNKSKNESAGIFEDIDLV